MRIRGERRWRAGEGAAQVECEVDGSKLAHGEGGELFNCDLEVTGLEGFLR